MRWRHRHLGLVAQVRGFAVVAIICTTISIALFAGLRPWLGTQWANTISLILCSVLNTSLNRRFSFGISNAHLWWRDQLRGVGVMALALALTSGSLWLLHQLVVGPALTTELAVIVLGNMASALTRFLLLRYWIFRRVLSARAAAPAETPHEAASSGARK